MAGDIDNERKEGEQNEKVQTQTNNQEDKRKVGEKSPVPASKAKDIEPKYVIVGIAGALLVILLVSGTVLMFRVGHESVRGWNDGRTGGFNMMRGWDGFNMMGRRGFNQGTIAGKVTAVNGKTFTVKTDDQSLKVQINDTTRFPIDSATTVKTGDTVWVWGQKDSNGTVQATQITVNP